jgi:hypothetical protein
MNHTRTVFPVMLEVSLEALEPDVLDEFPHAARPRLSADAVASAIRRLLVVC